MVLISWKWPLWPSDDVFLSNLIHKFVWFDTPIMIQRRWKNYIHEIQATEISRLQWYHDLYGTAMKWLAFRPSFISRILMVPLTYSPSSPNLFRSYILSNYWVWQCVSSTQHLLFITVNFAKNNDLTVRFICSYSNYKHVKFYIKYSRYIYWN